VRIAVIADIHGNILALDAVLIDIAAQAVDLIIDLGDCVSGPLWPRETFERLRALGAPTVRGNHDRLVGMGKRGELGPSDAFARDHLTAEDRAVLAGLPVMQEFVSGVIGFHATPDNDERYLLDDIVDGRLVRAPLEKIAGRLGPVSAGIVLMGHSHRADMVRLANGTFLINPGSVGDPGYDDPTGRKHVSEAGTPHARYAVVDLSGSESMPDVTFRAVSYDFERAARRAEENGRPEWAHALRTGFMPPAGLLQAGLLSQG
jgi:predicted phosphodiesterase